MENKYNAVMRSKKTNRAFEVEVRETASARHIRLRREAYAYLPAESREIIEDWYKHAMWDSEDFPNISAKSDNAYRVMFFWDRNGNLSLEPVQEAEEPEQKQESSPYKIALMRHMNFLEDQGLSITEVEYGIKNLKEASITITYKKEK